MAEETDNATTEAPKGIIMTCIGGAIVGFGLIMSILFSTTDIDSASGATNAAIYVFA
jgi:hypothetical protein